MSSCKYPRCAAIALLGIWGAAALPGEHRTGLPAGREELSHGEETSHEPDDPGHPEHPSETYSQESNVGTTGAMGSTLTYAEQLGGGPKGATGAQA
jgi:hypothetical protein